MAFTVHSDTTFTHTTVLGWSWYSNNSVHAYFHGLCWLPGAIASRPDAWHMGALQLHVHVCVNGSRFYWEPNAISLGTGYRLLHVAETESGVAVTDYTTA